MASNSPCGVCMRKINIKIDTKKCNNCMFPVHIKCSRLTKKEYSVLKDDYFCIKCIAKSISFSNLTDNEFYLSVIKCTKLDYTPDFNFLPSPAQQKLFNKLNHLINQTNLNQYDDDDDGEDDRPTSNRL